MANYLNNHGYTKKLRQNGTIPGFSASFIKKIIDNPVYVGKIAYGRRRTEKKTGTRNETHVVEQSDFPVYEGVHEAIISEEDWDSRWIIWMLRILITIKNIRFTETIGCSI